MRDNRNSAHEKGGAPSWMTTYGDMVTLLLTFFVLLYSFSSIDAEKWQALVVSLSGGSKGVLQHETEVAELEKKESPKIEDLDELQAELAEFQELYENLKQYVEENQLASQIILSKTDSEIQIRFADNVLFDSGKANLKPNAMEILTKITAALISYKDSIKMIRIEGHTDNVAINTSEFPSNWELSTARAVEVLRYLVEKKQIKPDIISAVGYGEYHPIASNNTEQGRTSNRRVDFVIARSTGENF